MISKFNNLLKHGWVESDSSCHLISRGLKIAVLGAMSSVGQPLSLLLRNSSLFKEIAVQDDEEGVDGLAFELNAIDFPGRVTSHFGKEGFKSSLLNSNIVMMAGGKVNCENDIFKNCQLVYEYAKNCVSYAPDAVQCVITGPLTSTFAVAGEVFRTAQKNFHYKAIGVNSLLTVRADTALGTLCKSYTDFPIIPIVGGCTTKTSIPLISQVAPKSIIPTSSLIHMIQKYQSTSTGSETTEKDLISLSVAFASSRFAFSLAGSMQGKGGFVENAFVMTNCVPEIPCFGVPVTFGKYGVSSTYGIPKNLNFYEAGLLKSLIPTIVKEVKSGIQIYKEITVKTEKTTADVSS